ncbi:hypothetical protein D3C77_477560 [compost metagenome]
MLFSKAMINGTAAKEITAVLKYSTIECANLRPTLSGAVLLCTSSTLRIASTTAIVGALIDTSSANPCSNNTGFNTNSPALPSRPSRNASNVNGDANTETRRAMKATAPSTTTALQYFCHAES